MTWYYEGNVLSETAINLFVVVLFRKDTAFKARNIAISTLIILTNANVSHHLESRALAAMR
jgi:hypothetical protein